MVISVLKVNLNIIRENIKNYREKLKPWQKFCAVVKADAYGFGAKKICREIDDLVDYFAVSSKEEFMSIKNIVSKPILLLEPIYENITKIARHGCEFCVSNVTQLNTIYSIALKNKNIKFKLHLAINTGMNRFGLNDKNDVLEIIRKVQKTQNISIFGVFSHFYCGNQENFVNLQSKKFLEFKKFLYEITNTKNITFHISNTSGFEFCHEFDMVRIGIGMYLFNNKDCFSLESKIVEIQNLKKGETAGYGRAFLAIQNTKVAVVNIGYADGVMRNISGRGFVLVNGNFCKILAVCMDSIIIDITNVNAGLEDDVILIGKSGGKQIFVCDFALWCDTIDYEIMTRISGRVKRVYLGGKTNANYNRKVSCKKIAGG